jgi:pteridine reductase
MTVMDPGATDGRLAGRVVLITGGRRVGSDLARILAARGATVAMTYHTSRAAIEQTISAIAASGGKGMAVAADLTRPAAAENAVQEVVNRFGRLDALVNMASVYKRTPLATLSASDVDALIAANLTAPFHAALSSARFMLTQTGEDGIKGKIVMLGDWASERPYKDYLPYLVAKGGLATLTLALAKELAPNIPVALIQPAMIDPPPELTESDINEVIEQTPLRRFGSSTDVNRLILYLLDGTNFVTGSCFRVDGGRFLGTGD